jgi:E3 ubiquitin-protein ligase DOA10
LWWVLDPHETGRVDSKCFMDLLSLSKMVHCDLCSETVLQRCIPQVYNSRPSRIVISMVKSKMFRYFFDVLILINTVCIACNVEYVENAFIAAFLLEVLLKVLHSTD